MSAQKPGYAKAIQVFLFLIARKLRSRVTDMKYATRITESDSTTCEKYMPSSTLKRQVISAALFISALFIPLTSTVATDIRVGVVLDQNGVNADTGRDYIVGARTWFDHINANGGVNRRRIQVIVKDDEGVAANAWISPTCVNPGPCWNTH